MENKEVLDLLGEIRDVQRQHFEAYSRASSESISIQRRGLELQQAAVEQQQVSVDAQARHIRLYRKVLMVSAAVGAFFIWFITSR